ncbi:hypothetical protein CJ010_00815 [Azoarcus sp. DD4]|uniref:hypothetical protein n=1 Tax=Azoarcus sp. DD4 TaxID=2027405 RepID=UPI00112E9CCE|nr:hypothetical protein [Azoarcus sp. DD4]QDF95194.1 hypothetical protein CJ010_00815 [Azoarcus sp. DD4]
MTISYIEKGIGLHHAIEAAGHRLRQVDGVWISTDDAAVQAIIDGYSLATAKATKKAEVRAIAREKYDLAVAGISPGELAGWPVLLEGAAAYAADGTITTAISIEAQTRGIPVADLVAKIESNAAQYQAVRAAIAGTDGKLRDEIDALTTFEAVAAYDVTGGWPL